MEGLLFCDPLPNTPLARLIRLARQRQPLGVVPQPLEKQLPVVECYFYPLAKPRLGNVGNPTPSLPPTSLSPALRKPGFISLISPHFAPYSLWLLTILTQIPHTNLSQGVPPSSGLSMTMSASMTSSLAPPPLKPLHVFRYPLLSQGVVPP